jgi:hypothetical protein
MNIPILEDILYRSTLLDADDEPLTAATVRFYKSQNRGRLCPQTAQNRDHLLTSAKKLRREDGAIFDLIKIEHEPVQFPNSEGYFLFEFKVGSATSEI